MLKTSSRFQTIWVFFKCHIVPYLQKHFESRILRDESKYETISDNLFQKGLTVKKIRNLLFISICISDISIIAMLVAMVREFGFFAIFGYVDSLFTIVSLWGKYIEYRIGFVAFIISIIVGFFCAAIINADRMKN